MEVKDYKVGRIPSQISSLFGHRSPPPFPMGQNGAEGGGEGRGGEGAAQDPPREIRWSKKKAKAPPPLSSSRKKEGGPSLVCMRRGEERDFLRDFLGKETKEGECSSGGEVGN